MSRRVRGRGKSARQQNAKELSREMQAKQKRLAEAEEILQAIRQGEVDALMIKEQHTDRLVMLKRFDELAADNAELRSQIAQRAHIEAALHATQEELRALSTRLLAAQDEERRRISRDLHDDIIQQLAALAIDAEAAAQQMLSPKDASHVFRSLHGQTVNILTAIRHLAHGLHPAILTDLGLAIALQRYAKEFSQRTGMLCNLKLHNLTEGLPVRVMTSLYKIALECLGNVQKHAKAKEVVIELARTGDWLTLSVRDNGVGFTLGSEEHGLGLVSMRARAYMLHGVLTVESRPGDGTMVSVQVPYPQVLA